MLVDVTILLIGFSIICGLVLLVAYLFFLLEMRKSLAGKLAASALLLCLIGLQLAHYAYFRFGLEPLENRLYGSLLIVVPLNFYFFSRVVLFPDVLSHWRDFLHALPLVFSHFVPIHWLVPMAFTIGSVYTIWFAQIVWRLGVQRSRFRFEMFFFGMFALMALFALGVGLALPYLSSHFFYLSYANAISLAMIAVLSALVFFPHLLSDLNEVTELAYSKSKLQGVDTGLKVVELERLMRYEKIYENEELRLSDVAQALQLNGHQLSELVNRHFSMGFSRYVREHRVQAARELLVAERQSSILAISMETGFKSQSSFYSAFKEVTGESPGEYRKRVVENS